MKDFVTNVAVSLYTRKGIVTGIHQYKFKFLLQFIFFRYIHAIVHRKPYFGRTTRQVPIVKLPCFGGGGDLKENPSSAILEPLPFFQMKLADRTCLSF